MQDAFYQGRLCQKIFDLGSHVKKAKHWCIFGMKVHVLTNNSHKEMAKTWLQQPILQSPSLPPLSSLFPAIEPVQPSTSKGGQV